MSTTVVIEVSGGVVQSACADGDVRVILVDWDNIEEGDEPGEMSVDDMKDMGDDTREVLEDAGLLQPTDPS